VLYHTIGALFPTLKGTTASIVDRKTKELYNAKRFDIYRGVTSLPTYREQPFPLSSQSCSLDKMADGRVAISFKLGERRWTLPLGNRAHFARQLSAMDKIIDGSALQVESRIGEAKCGSTHRPSGTGRDGGGQKNGTRVVATIVCWLPKRDNAFVLSGTLLVRTGPTSFLRARMMGRTSNERWSHEDHVRKWVAAHRRRLQRMSDDQKVERRVGIEPSLASARERICDRQFRRIDSFIHQKSTQVAELALRLRASEVVYDDNDGSWVSSFPWFKFWSTLEYKLSERGISLKTSDARKKEFETAKNLEQWLAMFAALEEINKEQSNGITGN